MHLGEDVCGRRAPDDRAHEFLRQYSRARQAIVDATALHGHDRRQLPGQGEPRRIPCLPITFEGHEPIHDPRCGLSIDSEHRDSLLSAVPRQPHRRHEFLRHGFGVRRIVGSGEYPSRRSDDPTVHAQIGADHLQQRTQPAARAGTCNETSMPVEHETQVRGSRRRQLPDHALGDRGESDVGGYTKERQPVLEAGVDQIVGHDAVVGCRQRRDPGLGHRPYERPRVLGARPPHQAGQDQFAPAEVAARIEHVGGHDPSDGRIEVLGSDDRLQFQIGETSQITQPHGDIDLLFVGSSKTYTVIGVILRRSCLSFPTPQAAVLGEHEAGVEPAGTTR